MSDRGRSLLECPHCGEPLPRRARACKACGSEAATGWSRDGEDDATELAEIELDDDSYAEFLARELPAATPPELLLKRRRRLVFGLALCALFLWFAAHVIRG